MQSIQENLWNFKDAGVSDAAFMRKFEKNSVTEAQSVISLQPTTGRKVTEPVSPVLFVSLLLLFPTTNLTAVNQDVPSFHIGLKSLQRALLPTTQAHGNPAKAMLSPDSITQRSGKTVRDDSERKEK